jgi:hypothetical protein
MAGKSCSDEEFNRLFTQHGATETARILGVLERSVYKRRANSFPTIAAPSKISVKYAGRLPLELRNGTALIGSDLHIWPGQESTCLRAFKKFIKDIQPNAVILNGDVMDFPRISRHPQNWESAPDPQEEIEAAQDHLNDMVKSCKRGSDKFWTLGNHDARWESTFANQTPQMRGVKGVHLSDHFSSWQKAMSVFINENVDGGATMVKHRFKSGQGAPRANTLNAGVHMVTGHLHSQKVIPVSDYRGDRYGVDTGCIADKEHRAFGYAEDAPLDWRSGFAVLTYKDGKLLYPELVTKWSDESVQWRGKIIKV